MTEPGYTRLTDLAAERLGGRALFCTDDFFAEKENLLRPGRGIFIPDKYTDHGKWMDGWESRRKRVPGHDYCIIQLATAGSLAGVDIDTNHFLGNHPPHASIDACYFDPSKNFEDHEAVWEEVLPKSPLLPGSQNFFAIDAPGIYTHVRLNIYPDGGVARLKVYGEVKKDWNVFPENERIDLAAALNGAIAIACNDMFFSHMQNLIMPGKGLNMGDGWETKRNRTPGNKDWVIIRLAHRGVVNEIEIDTRHFKGNYPDRCMVEGCDISREEENKWADGNIEWKTILASAKLLPDHEHSFVKELQSKEIFSHVRLTIMPDGGISRLRVWGKIK
jgi:allantoicase